MAQHAIWDFNLDSHKKGLWWNETLARSSHLITPQSARACDARWLRSGRKREKEKRGFHEWPREDANLHHSVCARTLSRHELFWWGAPEKNQGPNMSFVLFGMSTPCSVRICFAEKWEKRRKKCLLWYAFQACWTHTRDINILMTGSWRLPGQIGLLVTQNTEI
jgi:hypothetical protein